MTRQRRGWWTDKGKSDQTWRGEKRTKPGEACPKSKEKIISKEIVVRD